MKKINEAKIKKFATIFIAIVLVLVATERFLDYKWENEHQKLLDKAIETGDVTYCSSYKHPLKCIYLVGKEKNDLSVCDSADLGQLSLSACKAAILDDEQYCRNNLESNILIRNCEEIFRSLRGTGDMVGWE